MATVRCLAVSKEDGVTIRGKSTIEWYDENNKPQIYCRGYYDSSTEEPLKTCKDCRDFVHGKECENDFKEFKKRNKIA